MLGCVQARFWQTMSTLPAQSNTLVDQYQETKGHAGLRFTASSNGVLLGSADGGVNWAVTGPSGANRTWVAIATCPFTSPGTSQYQYGVVAADAAGNMFAGAAEVPPTTSTATIPSTWTQLLDASTSASPVLGGTIISIACAGPRRSTAPTTTTFTVLVATSSSVWLGSGDAVSGLAISGQMHWTQQSGVAGVGTVYSGVAGTVVGTRSADQAAVYAVSYDSGVSTASLPAPSAPVSGAMPALTWNSIAGSLGTPDIVSVSLGTTFAAGTGASAVKVVVAIRNGHVHSSDAGGTAAWTQLSASPGNWKVAKFTTLGEYTSGGNDGRVMALLNNGTVYVTHGTTSTGNLVPASTAGPAAPTMMTQGNPLRFQPSCVDASVSASSNTDSRVTCVSGAPAALVSNNTYSGRIVTSSTLGSWPAVPDSTSALWRGMAVARTGPTIVAFAQVSGVGTGSDIYVSKTGGQSWRLIHTYNTAICAGIACDAECTKIALICSDRVLYSIDGGVTFVLSATTLSAPQTAIAMNTDGTILYLGSASSSDILVSTDTSTFATFITKSNVLPAGINTQSIAAGSGNVMAIGTTTTSPGTGMYISHDALATSPGLITPAPADSSGPFYSVKISDDGKVVAAYGGGSGSRSLHFRFCNVAGSSICATLTNGFNFNPGGIVLGSSASIAMTADGGRITVTGTGTPSTKVYTATQSGGGYPFWTESLFAYTWQALACSGDGGTTFLLPVSGDAQQAYG